MQHSMAMKKLKDESFARLCAQEHFRHHLAVCFSQEALFLFRDTV